ncbi:cell division control protein 6 homolog isoform X2 [Hydra vulgaris]|uniref:Cell division control protein n=1 Tax=Hydra vulgaris TaxID=6087 RepID=A0ABM4C4J1_HYDVU
MVKLRGSRKIADENVKQKKISFPQKKSREVHTKSATDLDKKQTVSRKRKISSNNENVDIFEKSPVKHCSKSPESKISGVIKKSIIPPILKSPLLDKTNKHVDLSLLTTTKRKLSLVTNNNSTKLSQIGNPYSSTRLLLHTSTPDRLLCREKELSFIEKFIKCTLLGTNPGSLYMSGAPGTGKTASLTKILEKLQVTGSLCQIIFLNCMSIKVSQSIFVRLANELSTTSKYNSKNAFKYLENFFVGTGSKILLVLDEIDQLESNNQDVLYKLFELPFLPNSRLTLIGIANALDLTERILPRLQTKGSCLPALLQFTPYSMPQIVSIIQERLGKVGGDIIDPMAIQFCARKVSSMSGDIRKAFDILKRAIEIVEFEIRKLPTLENKKVNISHVSAVCNQMFNSQLAVNNTYDGGLPLQQKLIVCTLMASLKDNTIKEILISKLYECYCKVCKSRQINCLSEEEYNSACSLLDSQGILSLTASKTKDFRSLKVSLRLQENELEHALQDKTLMSSILACGIPK